MAKRISKLKKMVIISRRMSINLLVFSIINIILLSISVMIFGTSIINLRKNWVIACFNILAVIILLVTIFELILIANLSSKEARSGQQLEHDNISLSSEELFSEFIKKTEQLTPTERNIFNFYLEGKTSKEVTQQLGITVNTLKVHNNHIYKKLDVSSKEELSLYINLISKSGMISEISK